MARQIHVFRSPERFVAGTVGQPGDRTFYVQAAGDGRVISVLVEKQQVDILADRVDALLDEVTRRFGAELPARTTESDDTDPLASPVDSEFRVGTMGLGWEADSHTVVIELLAVSETPLDESVVLDDTEDGPDALRVFLSPAQARSFCARAHAVVGSGRPPCPICGEAMDPTGHLCVRTNGYRRGVDPADLSEPFDDV